MQLHSVTMARDEEDVIEAFVRHTLAYVDVAHIVVHQSVDQTLPILRLMQEEGLPVRVTVSNDTAFRQGTTLSDRARHAFGLGAQNVFVLDADEFLVASSRAALEKNLMSLAADATGAIPWRTYIPLPGDLPGEMNVLRRITHRAATERKMLGKVILGPSFAADLSLGLLEGSHWVYRNPHGDYKAQPMQVFTDMWLAHFPVRSAEQLVCKVLQRRWQRRIAWVDEPISRLVASGWRSSFDRMTEIVLEHGTLTPEQLAWFAYDYSGAYDAAAIPPLESFRQLLVPDACGHGGVLRYASSIRNPLAALYKWLDRVVAIPPIAAAPDSEGGR